MEYKITVQFNKELATYVAVAETINLTATGDSAGEAVSRLTIKYLELIEKASLERSKFPEKETLDMIIPNLEVAFTEERNLVLSKAHDEMLETYNKQKQLMAKILASKKTDTEKLELIDKLSKA